APNQPYWTLAATSGSGAITLPEGTNGYVPLSAGFHNGSAGPLTLSASQTAGGPLQSISTSAADSSGTVSFTAPYGSGGKDTTLTVSGTDGGGNASTPGALHFGVHIIPALALTTVYKPTDAPQVVPQGCGVVPLSATLTVAAGSTFTGDVNVSGTLNG